jgi:hypothetical protein
MLEDYRPGLPATGCRGEFELRGEPSRALSDVGRGRSATISPTSTESARHLAVVSPQVAEGSVDSGHHRFEDDNPQARSNVIIQFQQLANRA